MALRSHRYAGGIGSALVKVGKAVGRVATGRIGRTALGATGFGGAVLGIAGSSLASRAASGGRIPGTKIKVNPTKFLPGGKPLFSTVKRKRTNFANIRALNRAIRRVQGAEKIFRKILQVQGKPHGGIRPKAKRRR